MTAEIYLGKAPAGTFVACPSCGNQTYRVTDYGCAIEYSGTFGKDDEELVDIKHYRPVPVKAYCSNCNRRFNLVDVNPGRRERAEERERKESEVE